MKQLKRAILFALFVVSCMTVISGCQTGIKSASAAVKYRGNTTFDCTTSFDGGTAVGTENN